MNNDKIVRDGESVRVPMQMMDATQKAIANGPRSAHEDYCQRIGDAWRRPTMPAAASVPTNDRESALAARDQALTTAWKKR
jgi:hypothetical protein